MNYFASLEIFMSGTQDAEVTISLLHHIKFVEFSSESFILRM